MPVVQRKKDPNDSIARYPNLHINFVIIIVKMCLFMEQELDSAAYQE
jgi:hypothetical protein